MYNCARLTNKVPMNAAVCLTPRSARYYQLLSIITFWYLKSGRNCW